MNAVPDIAATPRPRVAFSLLAGVQFVLVMSVGVVSLSLPAMQRDLHLTRGEVALVNTSYGLAFVGLLLLGGRLADVYGRRRVFLLGSAVFSVGSAVSALAPSAGLLVGARFGQGVGAALAAPAALALVSTVFPQPRRRDGALAVWGGVSSAGGTVGTLLGGALGALSWRLALGASIAAGIAAVAAGRLLPADPRSAPGRRLDLPGAVLATTGATVLCYGLVASLDAPWTYRAVWVPVLAGLLLLAALLLVEFRATAPLLPLAILASARRASGMVALLVGAAGIATVAFLLSLYLQQIKGWPPFLASLAFLPYLVVLGASWVGGRLTGRFGIRAVVVTGLLFAVAGLCWLSRLEVDSRYVAIVLPGLLLFTFGVGLTFAGATLAALRDVPAGEAGVTAGVMNTAMELGPTVGLALLVSLAGVRTARLLEAGAGDQVATTGGYVAAFLATAVACVLTATAAVLTLRKNVGTPN